MSEGRAAGTTALSAAHRRRLREVWRSAGWPYQDLIEAELVAAGLLERQRDAGGHETVRVSDAGVREIAAGARHNRSARDAHEALVERVVLEMLRAGRLVWRGLTLRAPLVPPEGAPVRWAMAMPDVFSIRHTTVEDYVEPVVHEIKVHRSDLLADLKRPDKGAAYCGLSSQCWYVFPAGLARPEEVPAPFGVMTLADGVFTVERPAASRACRMALGTWMELARRSSERADPMDAQAPL